VTDMSKRRLQGTWSVKAILKQIAPPIVLDVYRRFRHPPTWAGVYPRIGAVPAGDPASRVRGWRKSAIDPRVYDRLPAEVVQEYDYLGVLAAVVCRQHAGALTVVDFGGGLGVCYVHLLRTLRDCQRLEYHVIDLPWACDEGARLFAGDARVRFHPSWPELPADVDIVHALSSLQYVEDYPAVLRRLCAVQAGYLLLADLHTGDFPTYASAQLNVPGTVFPLWFVNRAELIGLVRDGGYDLVFDSLMPDRKDQRNFPRHFRLYDGRRRVMLFARSRPAPGRT